MNYRLDQLKIHGFCVDTEDMELELHDTIAIAGETYKVWEIHAETQPTCLMISGDRYQVVEVMTESPQCGSRYLQKCWQALKVFVSIVLEPLLSFLGDAFLCR